MACYAGVDLGATNVRAVVGDDEGTVVGSDRRATPQGRSGIAVTEAVLDTIRAACRDAGVDPGALAAAGVGSFGPLDLAEGREEATRIGTVHRDHTDHDIVALEQPRT